MRVGSPTGDQGVSVVVGAILVLAIGLAALAAFQLTVVPEWERQAEADHMATVGSGLSALTTRMAEQTHPGQEAPLTSSVPLTPGKVAFVEAPSGNHQVRFEPYDQPARLLSPDFELLSFDGEPVGDLHQDFDQDGPVSQVAEVHTLRAELGGVGSRATVEVLEDGERVGTFEAVVQERSQPTSATHSITVYDVHVTVEANGETLHDQPVLTGASANQVAGYRIDLMDPDLRFVQVLHSAQAPFDLSLEQADYALTYTRVTDEGHRVFVGGEGRHLENLHRTYPAGRVLYQANNHRYLPQTYQLEHGGVLLSQDDGAVVRTAPTMEVLQAGGVLTVRVDLITLDGPARVLSGASEATLSLQQESEERLWGRTTDQVTLWLPTTESIAWARHWVYTLSDAGLPTQAWGVDPDPEDDRVGIQFRADGGFDTVYFELHQTTLRTQVTP